MAPPAQASDNASQAVSISTVAAVSSATAATQLESTPTKATTVVTMWPAEHGAHQQMSRTPPPRGPKPAPTAAQLHDAAVKQLKAGHFTVKSVHLDNGGHTWGKG